MNKFQRLAIVGVHAVSDNAGLTVIILLKV